MSHHENHPGGNFPEQQPELPELDSELLKAHEDFEAWRYEYHDTLLTAVDKITDGELDEQIKSGNSFAIEELTVKGAVTRPFFKATLESQYSFEDKKDIINSMITNDLQDIFALIEVTRTDESLEAPDRELIEQEVISATEGIIEHAASNTEQSLEDFFTFYYQKNLARNVTSLISHLVKERYHEIKNTESESQPEVASTELPELESDILKTHESFDTYRAEYYQSVSTFIQEIRDGSHDEALENQKLIDIAGLSIDADKAYAYFQAVFNSDDDLEAKKEQTTDTLANDMVDQMGLLVHHDLRKAEELPARTEIRERTAALTDYLIQAVDEKGVPPEITLADAYAAVITDAYSEGLSLSIQELLKYCTQIRRDYLRKRDTE